MRNFKITVNGTVYDVSVEEVGTAVAPATAPVAAPAPAAVSNVAPKAAPAKVDGKPIRSPFPGTVAAVNVKAGDNVKRGDVLCIIEAMKMENDICAPEDGCVVSVNVNTGTKVDADELLITLG